MSGIMKEKEKKNLQTVLSLGWNEKGSVLFSHPIVYNFFLFLGRDQVPNQSVANH